MTSDNATSWTTYVVADLIADGSLIIGDGYRAKNSEMAAEGLPFARAGNIRGGINVDGADLLSTSSVERAGGKVSQPGDVIFTSKGTVGRFAFVRDDDPQVVYSPQVCFWRSAAPDLIDSEFLYYWMHGPDCLRQFNALKGQTDMADYISLRDQATITVRLPPLVEQRRIAGVLGALDSKVRAEARLSDRLLETAAHMFAGVVEEARASGATAVPASHLIDINPKVVIKKGQPTPFLEMAATDPWAVRPRSIGSRPFSGGSKFEPGDTLLAKITGCIEHGKGGFVDYLPGPAAGSTEFLVLRAGDRLTPESVFLISRWPSVREHLIRHMVGSSGRQRVPPDAFETLELTVPETLSVWSGEAAFIEAAFARSKAAWDLARHHSAIRDELVPKLVTGGLRVSEDYDPDAASAFVG
ncbi:hypothetical protein GKE82_00575 [Conexibacter sp. W3-3-2]|uniref:restriction endonuclease subunit S n=1 Tax=Conexibacter sp. W3-3-2 TaxID=2675227 RepID=UPI0012B83307|nr:restriction endonuclease subunit S [Conexibacter sp. W3-3-2]MTD42836.1 hypothetical protein [Conexibacter sp. W3-3-2]